jgi:hypothetical protein
MRRRRDGILEHIVNEAQRRTTPYSRLIRSLLLVAAVSALTGCFGAGVDWSDIQGVNLIANRGFDAVGEDGEPVWYFADGLLAGTTNATTGTETPVDLVGFEPVNAAVHGTLPEGVSGPVYRYEVRNLLESGDFEASATELGTMWVADFLDPPETPGTVELGATSAALQGSQGMQIATRDGSEKVRIDLATHLADGFVANRAYAFNVDFRSNSTTFGLVLETPDGSEGSELNTYSLTRGQVSQNTVFSYPGTFVPATSVPGTGLVNLMYRDTSVSPDPTFFTFGGAESDSPGVLTTSIDRITIVHSDIAHYLRLSVPYRDAGRSELLSGGSYELSVWAAPDPTAESANRFVARALSAGLDPSTNGAAGDRGTPIIATAVGTRHEVLTDVTGWTEFTWTIPSSIEGRPFGAPSDTIAFDIVIEIGNSALGPKGKDAGSILLAAPSLTWNP